MECKNINRIKFIQWTGNNIDEFVCFIKNRTNNLVMEEKDPYTNMLTFRFINTDLHLFISYGDYLVYEANGEFCDYSEEAFKKKFETVSDKTTKINNDHQESQNKKENLENVCEENEEEKTKKAKEYKFAEWFPPSYEVFGLCWILELCLMDISLILAIIYKSNQWVLVVCIAMMPIFALEKRKKMVSNSMLIFFDTYMILERDIIKYNNRSIGREQRRINYKDVSHIKFDTEQNVLVINAITESTISKYKVGTKEFEEDSITHTTKMGNLKIWVKFSCDKKLAKFINDNTPLCVAIEEC